MNISICTFDKFNEIDSLISFHILSRLKKYYPFVNVCIVSDSNNITSMNGLKITADRNISEIINDDVIIFGSSSNTNKLVENEQIISKLKKSISFNNQLICSQCSGALFLEKLGLLKDLAVSTDIKTAEKLRSKGYEVVNKPISINSNIVSCGGCLSAIYLSAYIIKKYFGTDALSKVLKEITSNGEFNLTLDNILYVID
ncbi:DJ-1/PfpI family protein [Francisella sp. 19X1-34]|uniref:DJ-1/PfpI family protein n=1 Tax=Francisella sp. 19X1-34 TaxID=3087177 RepID=UPI002E301547|nr:DJ-1/PfpI family protein [Francisella sp. 19X1-34]MED7788053.1 DJ-1/PfpI family protein [Francisella sp. 19X1-34]